MLTYGGIPLLLPDADGDVQHWLRQNQDIADGVFHGDTTLADKSPRRGLLAWGGDRKGIGQTVANYAAAPPPRINSLYWPTGATRWARGYFLATGKNKNLITAQAHSAGGNSPLNLVWGDPVVRTPLTASMWLLPPRPVSRVAAPYDSEEEQLWLLPLVDSRYWWRERPTGDLEISSSTTWEALFSALGSALGITVALPTAVAASYLSPDTYEFTRRYENAAMMLDAAALSVGKRIVRRCDGTVRAESNADAQAVITSNAGLPAALQAGGYYHLEAGYRPEKVTTTFRKWRHYRVLQKGQVYTVDKTPSIATALATSTTKVVHSTMFADYSSDVSPPANTADLDALAQVISDDFYGWMRSRYDLTFAGAQPWTPNGFDDSVVWDFGRQVVGGSADGKRLGQTRVQSMGVDFGFDLQLSQKNTLTLFEPIMLGKADSDIAQDASGTVSIWEGRGGSKADETRNVTAWATTGDIVAGQWVAVEWVEDDWEIVALDSDKVTRFELTATLALSGDAAAVLLTDDSGDWTNSATAIQVYDLHTSEGMWAGVSGYRGWAIKIEGTHASGRQRYGIIWMEQIAQTIEFIATEYMGATTANQLTGSTVTWYDHQGKDPGSTVTVRDPNARFPDVYSGAKGTAVYDYHNGYYRVVSCQRVALFAAALLTADSCGSTMSIDGFVVRPTGDYVGAPPTTPTAPSNTCGHAGLDNDVVLLRRTNNTMPQPSWEVVDITKHAVEVVVDNRYDTLNLQHKQRTIYAEICDNTTPSWETWTTATECTE
jgi:hypothetical protein